MIRSGSQQVCLQTLQAVVPEPLVPGDPLAHQGKLLGDEMIVAFAAMPLLGHQAGIEQDAKVLRDRRATHLKMPRQRVDGTVGLGEQIEHLTPRRMADRHEHIGLARESRNHAGNIRKKLLTRQGLALRLDKKQVSRQSPEQ